jgi:uncharacterized BrkB/YihY/UPF0761 family membrane protein
MVNNLFLAWMFAIGFITIIAVVIWAGCYLLYQLAKQKPVKVESVIVGTFLIAIIFLLVSLEGGVILFFMEKLL